MNKFASWRLGKSSVLDIHRLNKLPLGIQKDLPRFQVKCTQVPQEFEPGTYVFIWLGSDNNKGIPTEWKQGYKAIGRLVHINRGERFNDESTSLIEIVYIFSEVFNRIDILRAAPIPYYWCSALPIIGLDDHSNQTIRMFAEDEERSDIKAFFEVLKEIVPEFSRDAILIDTTWESLLDFECVDPKSTFKQCHEVNNAVVVEDATLNQFARKCFSYFYNLDSFDAFWSSTTLATVKSGASFRTIKDKDRNIVFTGLFKADNTEEGQYFPDGFEIDGHQWYLPSNWSKTEFAPGTNGRNALSIQCLQRFVELFYSDYRIRFDQDYYKLIRIKESNSYVTSNLPEFWKFVGTQTLGADPNFSKLPLYYHKGHVRVKSNYGGATNFSVGFYDANSERVDKNVSFEFFGQAGAEETTFYLSTEVKNPKAFDYFIPVFNDTYLGIFEIKHIGDTYTFVDKRKLPITPYNSNKPRQVIYFGAPGTGKSHAVDKILKKEAPQRNIRTTFHPDSDYSSFVGCYKPSMRDGNIEYSFTAQAFINAYVGAWSDLSQPFFLVIEEINRGNCAQIFGDIFQLLDRDSFGESSYGIRPDSDLQQYLADKLGLFSNIPETIRLGFEMRLPRNLFIYATMNTSDQSLFPIDSAFKRRWDWRYTAIKPAVKDHIINVNGSKYNWTSFICKVNEKILDLTKSEDKQLGYWFIKPDDNYEISWKLFVSKALFYIWNDVIKDYATLEKADSPFGRNYAFRTFFDENGEPLAERVIAFLDAMGVEKMPDSAHVELDESNNDSDDDNSDVIVDSEGNTSIKSGSAFSYTLDGSDFDGIGKAIQQIVNTLCKTKSYAEIEADFIQIVKKTYKKEPAIKPQLPSELNPDENGRNRWYVKPFTDINGKQFSLISLWPDSYFDRIKDWVDSYPDIFPGGFIQHKTK